MTGEDRPSGPAGGRADARHRILEPGRNCWCVAHAGRAAVLIDAAYYFSRLEQALLRARRSILIVGWDFDGRIALSPGAGPTLGERLRALVEERPDLHVRILVWDFAIFYAPSNPRQLLLGADWSNHPRIELRLDNRHPLYGAHHQKLVCVDDALAFVGGIDLTVGRWDTTAHAADEPIRRNPDGSFYGPVHDIQMAVDGEAARALAEVAKERWRIATGYRPDPIPAGADPWPLELVPDFADVPVAVARTVPAWENSPAIREAAKLTTDALNAARRCIYVEAQYFTAPAVGECIAERLAAEDGPEVVILVTHSSEGWLEHFVMGSNRDRLIRRLKKADRFDRLRVYYPVVPGAGGDEHEVHIHSKLLVIDDDLIRIGSSNLNNRSVGLDTECDIAIEAADEAARKGIRSLRERLLAEHLDAAPEDVARAVAAAGSVIGGIEALNRRARGLRPFAALEEEGPTSALPGTDLLDPEEPFEPLRILRWAAEG